MDAGDFNGCNWGGCGGCGGRGGHGVCVGEGLHLISK